jgi:hypothetical protein
MAVDRASRGHAAHCATGCPGCGRTTSSTDGIRGTWSSRSTTGTRSGASTRPSATRPRPRRNAPSGAIARARSGSGPTPLQRGRLVAPEQRQLRPVRGAPLGSPHRAQPRRGPEQLLAQEPKRRGAGRNQAPHAWVVPADQVRKADVAHMLNLLATQGVELHRADAGLSVEEYAAAGVPPPSRGDDSESGRASSGRSGDARRRGRSFDVRPGDYITSPTELRAQPHGEAGLSGRRAPSPTTMWRGPFRSSTTCTVHEAEDPEILERADDRGHRGGAASRAGSRPRAGTPDWWVVRYEASAHMGSRPAMSWGKARRSTPCTSRSTPRARRGLRVRAWLISVEVDGPRSDERPGRSDTARGDRGRSGAVVEEVDRHPQTLPRIALLHSWRNTQDDGSVRYAFDDGDSVYVPGRGPARRWSCAPSSTS